MSPIRPSALILLAALIAGCAAPGAGPTAATRPTTKPTTRPVHETITLELDADRGPFAPRARGLLRPGAAKLPTELLRALGPLAQGTDGGPPPVLVTLGEVVKFDGAFPGEMGNWRRWNEGVEKLLRDHQADPRPRIYEVWKEPDKPPFKDRTNFFGAWVHTVRLVRRIAPDAVMMGPGMSKFDGGWQGEFLKVAKEYDVQPDVVCWHEDNLKHDINGHVSGAGENFWNDGTDRQRVIVMAAAAVESKYAAGDVPIFLAQFEKAVREQGWRPFTFHWGFKLTHLFTPDGKPRSLYHAYKEYVDLANAGRGARISASPSVEGLALWSEPTRTARLLLGRNRSRLDKHQSPGDVTLEIKGAATASAVHVRARRIENTGAKPSDGPAPAFEREFSLKAGQTRVPLPEFDSGDVYAIEITLRGDAATATRPPVAGPAQTNDPERPQ